VQSPRRVVAGLLENVPPRPVMPTTDHTRLRAILVRGCLMR
jgi:hypothetical protein